MLTKDSCSCAQRSLICDHPSKAEFLKVCQRVDALLQAKQAVMKSRSSLGRWLHRNHVLPGRAVCVRYAGLWMQMGLRALLALEWVRPGPMNTAYVYEGFKGLLAH